MPRDDHIDKPYLPNRKDFHLEKGTVMKSLMKKVFAAAAAIATVFGLAATTVATANAAGGNATLTVSTKDAKFAGKTVNAYKMFSATVSGDGGAVSHTLNDAWKPFFKNSVGLTDVTDANVNDKANEYVSKLTGKEKDLTAFAAKASNWAQNTANSITADATATVSKIAATDGKYTATFTGLDYGYYVVAVPGATVADTNSQYAALVRVHSTTVSVDIKGALPTVDKKVQVDGTGKDATDAKIGDTLKFTLTSTIPDMSAYNTYTFNFKDTLSKGLTFEQVKSVKVEDKTLSVNTDYTVTPPTAPNNTLTVAMKDFKTKQQANAGKKITVTYTATLNENAVVGGAGNVNSAKIQYSNNPSTNGTGESEPSKVRVFTYGFTVDKYTGKNYDDTATRLAGAEFTLAHKGGTAISFVKVADSATQNAVYRVAKADEAGATTTITTPANGKVEFRGLENGEYTLTETKAPAGYNKLASAIGVKVHGQNNGTDTTHATVTITYNNDNNGSNYDQTASNGVIPVQNKSGVTLPGTGGMGTIAFTVIGVLVIALGVAWTLKRKNA